METLVVKYKLKPGVEKIVEEWKQYCLDHRDEIIVRLKAEGVVVETAFIEKAGDEMFLYYFLKAHSLEKVYEIFDASQDPVDLYQKEFKDKVIESRQQLEVAVDFGVLG